MEKVFYKKLVNRIYGCKALSSAAEYEQLRTEVSAFVESLKDLPISELHQKFDEKYGELIKSVKMQEQIELQKKIVSILGFFKVLAIIAIILSVLNIFM